MPERIKADLSAKGIVFNIQRYSIHDGPGIRTSVFLKGCPLRCYWCQNPESQRIKPEIMLNPDLCTKCGACIKICKYEANKLDGDLITLDRTKCTGCGDCIPMCFSKSRTLQGKERTVGEVLEIVLKDRKEYKRSNGGITISGGELTMQPKFALELLKAAKEEGLHTAIETCGYTSWDNLKRILDYTDYVFFDIKALDPDVHKDGTGFDNRIILENAKKTAALPHLFMHVRTPLIPGYNDDKDTVMDIARFVKEELKLPPEHYSILRYNKYAEGKYDRLGMSVRAHHEPQPVEYIEELKAMIKSFEQMQPIEEEE